MDLVYVTSIGGKQSLPGPQQTQNRKNSRRKAGLANYTVYMCYQSIALH